MSSACALKCDIHRLVDSRWAGIAKGVGIQRIVGRIHMVQVLLVLRRSLCLSLI
jgi:DNA damage-inducible protein 1